MQNQETFDQQVTGMNEYCSTDLTGKKVEPSATQRVAGVDPGTTLPAQWWNFYINALTKKVNQFKASFMSIIGEMNNLGSVTGVAPDPNKQNQLAEMFSTKYPDFLAQFTQGVSDWAKAPTKTQSIPIATTNTVGGNSVSKLEKVDVLPIELGGTGKTSFEASKILQTDAGGGLGYLDFPQTGKFLMSGPNGTILLVDAMTSEDYVPQERFIVYDFAAARAENRKSIKIKKGVSLVLEIDNGNGVEKRRFNLSDTTSYDFTSQISEAGKDYYIYLVPNGESGVDVVCSRNSTFPEGSYTVNEEEIAFSGSNTRKIGQFHTLCVNAGNTLSMISSVDKGSIDSYQTSDGVYITVKKYDDNDVDGYHDFYTRRVTGKTSGYFYDVATCEHPLDRFQAQDILPESVWCLTFKPYSDGSGMVYDVDTDLAVDIYLQSGKGQNTVSEFGGTVADTRPQVCHADDMRQKRKFLLGTDEFTSAAVGSNEATNIIGNNPPSPKTAGGHIDTLSRRMISAIGCEECCGYLWQWTRDYAGLGGSSVVTAWGNTAAAGANTYTGGDINASQWPVSLDGLDAFGRMRLVTAVLVGGDWDGGAACGSRARGGDGAVSNAGASFGGRGASHVMRKAA